MLTMSSVLAQVYVVVAAGSVLSFIIRDLGEPAIAAWVIQVRIEELPIKNPFHLLMRAGTTAYPGRHVSFDGSSF